MDPWRAKRRYEINRRLSERADDALIAISVLKGRQQGGEFDHGPDDLRAKLDTGLGLLLDLQTALEFLTDGESEVSEDVSPQMLSMAELWADECARTTRNRALTELQNQITALEETQDSLSHYRSIRDTVNTLEFISDVTSATSKENVNRMKGRLTADRF